MGWSEFFRLTFTEGILDVRLKALLGAHMARLLGSEVWFRPLWEKARGLTEKEAGALLDFEGAPLSLREKAALRYSERITTDSLAADEELFLDLKRHFSDPELIELGLVVGMMNGTFRLSHSLGLGEAGGPQWIEGR